MNRNVSRQDEQLDDNDLLVMSKFSIRRSSVQQLLCMLLMHIFLIIAGVASLAQGNWLILALTGATYIALILHTILIAINIPRLAEVEVWIRRLVAGDFEHSVEPWGNDEVSKLVVELEALRQTSIHVRQIDTVTQLSENCATGTPNWNRHWQICETSRTESSASRSWRNWAQVTSGVAHEIRNPLQFIRRFTISSRELSEELQELLSESGDFNREEAAEIVNDIIGNMERIERHAGPPELHRVSHDDPRSRHRWRLPLG